jgi:aspartate kinase
MNADPKWYPNVQKIDNLSYTEAVELTYYGAQIIHPKTLKPLENKNIPLYVRSFYNPQTDGTIITSAKNKNILIPVFILKQNQVFITISPKDLSMIPDEKIIEIISFFKHFRIKMNLMQNSA